MSSQKYEKNLEQLSSMRVFELKAYARELNIKGRSIMRKQQLIDAIIQYWRNEEEKAKSVSKRENHKCDGFNIDGNKLVKCKNMSDKHYCPEHQHRYRLEKPDDCPVCMDTISNSTETPLECGHWIHKECLIPTELHICPVCRQSMKPHEITYIFGENHSEYNHYSHNSIPFIPTEIRDSNVVDMNIYNNQEHYFMDFPSENPFDDYEYQDNNEYIQEYDQYEENEPESIESLTQEQIETIVQEIQSRPRNNPIPYISLSNNLTFIRDDMRNNFIQFVNAQINNFGVLEHQYIDDLLRDEIRNRLFINTNDFNLLSISFNLFNSSLIDDYVSFHIRLTNMYMMRINAIFDELMFFNN